MAAFLRRGLGDSFSVDLPDAPGSPPDFWGARTDVEYKTALDLYASGGAPLDTYVLTHSIDDTGSTRDWMSPEGPSHWAPLQLEQIWERGATPYVRVEVDDLAGLVSGSHDARIRRMFQAFASFTDKGGGRRIILDVLPESNNDNHPYGDDPSRFKAAFGRVVEAARSELGNRVRTVFSALPRMSSHRHSHATWGAGGYRLFWPGRSLVDVAGISGYDDRAGSNISLYQSAISEMASVTGPGTPLMISLGGAPDQPSEAAQIDYVGALADFAAEHEQVVGIQWEDRRRGDADMRVSTTSGLQSGFATASAPARADGVDWLFSTAATEWIAERRAFIPFDDATSSVFVSDIRWLAATGITKGCASRMFCPNSHVTRGQMAAFLSRALGLGSPSQPIVFDDTRGHTFATEISKLAHAGITLGCNPPDNDRFCPNDDVTRAQMAAFMVRAGLTD